MGNVGRALAEIKRTIWHCGASNRDFSMRCRFLIALSVLSCAHLVQCQDQSGLPVTTLAPESAPVVQTSTEREGLIHLDVSVTDHAGKFVTGLAAKDFALSDGGPQKILSFRSSDAEDQNERLNEAILLLDEVTLSRAQSAGAKEDVIRFLRRNGGHLVVPTSVYCFTVSGLLASGPSSMDGNTLADEVAKNRYPRVLWTIPPPRTENMGDSRPQNTLWTTALKTVFTIALEQREKPGRKLLMWIGRGWTVSGVAQKHRQEDFELLVELSTRVREARMVIDEISDWPVLNFAYTNYLAGIRSVVELEKSTDLHPYAHFALPVLAIQSGGVVMDAGPKIPEAIEHCIESASGFYTMSLDPPNAHQVDEYHDLYIRVERPGVAVRTNTGYYNQPAFYDQQRVPVRSVTVAELEQLLEHDSGERDDVLAEELDQLELTERLSSGRLAVLSDRLGKHSKAVLYVLVDNSVFLNPPVKDIPINSVPSHAQQVEMLTHTVNYLNGLLPSLPDFVATRTTVQFAQYSPSEESSWKTANADSSLREWSKDQSTLLYRNGHEEQTAEKRKGKSSAQKSLDFIGVFGPIMQRVLRDAMSDGNGLTWSRWERGEDETEAVFRYSVHVKSPSYLVANCCLRNGDVFRTRPEYHGELTINPDTGAILRLTMESTPGWIVEPNLSPVRPVNVTGMMLEYGKVEIGGKQYICPHRSVVILRSRPVKQMNVLGEDLVVYGPYETLLNDIDYSNYHKFGSQSRMLPGFTMAPE